MATKRIESPLPGVIYLSHAPGEPVFKAPGDSVAAGDTLALVEVMKSYMPVEADQAGIFRGYLVESESVLEPGEPLCEIEV